MTEILSDIPFSPELAAGKLLQWYGNKGRDLPWRRTRDPYRIWLSEIMLQQTTVAAVIPYYEKFLKKFPDVKSLADAPLESVLELWSGLGYYSRARNLHAAAGKVVTEHRGAFPESVPELMQLPGVGRSTAGAIVSIAFNRPAPILDGNVRRVLARLMALDQPPREREAEKRLWQWAETLTPADRAHDYAQAIMDLGATVCMPRQPDCASCPITRFCQAKKTGRENELPVSGKKTKPPLRRQVVLVLENKGQVLLARRPPSGLLGGMWEFPCLEYGENEAEEEQLKKLGGKYRLANIPEKIGSIKHQYSHFRLEAQVYRAEAGRQALIAEADSFWHDADRLSHSPLHGAHQKALKLIMREMKE